MIIDPEPATNQRAVAWNHRGDTSSAPPEKVCAPASERRKIPGVHYTKKRSFFDQPIVHFHRPTGEPIFPHFGEDPFESASQGTIAMPGSVSGFWNGPEKAWPNMAVVRLHNRGGGRDAGFGRQPTRGQIQGWQGTLPASAVCAVSIDRAEPASEPRIWTRGIEPL